jgi:hypothetical protein
MAHWGPRPIDRSWRQLPRHTTAEGQRARFPDIVGRATTRSSPRFENRSVCGLEGAIENRDLEPAETDPLQSDSERPKGAMPCRSAVKEDRRVDRPEPLDEFDDRFVELLSSRRLYSLKEGKHFVLQVD